MRELIHGFVELETRLAREKGAFNLFALFLREDFRGAWDLLVGAKWIQEDRTAALKYLVDAISKDLGKQGLLAVSRIVMVDPNHQLVQDVNRSLPVEHGIAEVRHTDFFGQSIDHALFITSKAA